jgi:hypothetical protein
MVNDKEKEMERIGDLVLKQIERMKREGVYFDPPLKGKDSRYRCERCGAEVKLEEAYLAWYREEGWSFECAQHNADYDPKVCFFFANPADAIGWLAQLADKNWFEPSNFFELMKRIRGQRCGFYRKPAHPAAAAGG